MEIQRLKEIIEKQSKEIEELKEENEKYKNPPFFDEDKYTENDKIKAKIEEIEVKLENYSADKINIFSGQTYMEKFRLLGALYVLQSLLEKE